MSLPQGLIFVVDSNDRERTQEATEELQKMVSALVLSVCAFFYGFVLVLNGCCCGYFWATQQAGG